MNYFRSKSKASRKSESSASNQSQKNDPMKEEGSDVPLVQPMPDPSMSNPTPLPYDMPQAPTSYWTNYSQQGDPQQMSMQQSMQQQMPMGQIQIPPLPKMQNIPTMPQIIPIQPMSPPSPSMQQNTNIPPSQIQQMSSFSPNNTLTQLPQIQMMPNMQPITQIPIIPHSTPMIQTSSPNYFVPPEAVGQCTGYPPTYNKKGNISSKSNSSNMGMKGGK